MKTIEITPWLVEALCDEGTFNASLIGGELPDGHTFNYRRISHR